MVKNLSQISKHDYSTLGLEEHLSIVAFCYESKWPHLTGEVRWDEIPRQNHSSSFWALCCWLAGSPQAVQSEMHTPALQQNDLSPPWQASLATFPRSFQSTLSTGCVGLSHGNSYKRTEQPQLQLLLSIQYFCDHPFFLLSLLTVMCQRQKGTWLW